MMSEGLISFPTNLWTIQDVFIDSPVWKSNVLHLEEQIDHFEKWVEGFMKSLKQYVDAVIKYNAQTSNLCKKILPQNLDGSLIDPQVAGMIINTFASTLQCNLAFKTKLVSDLEDNLLHPLQRFVKHELKDFKEARKTFERISDKYESQIYRYNSLSRAKEASALREDAFQTYDVRKTFIRVSREYYAHLLSFKVRLEHVLAECFSSATSAQVEEANEAHRSCTQARTMLPGWQQWLEESKAMSEYQLEKIDKASQQLENGLVRKLRPYRSLRNYITPLNSGMVSSSPAADDISGFVDHSPSPRTSQINIMGAATPTTSTNEEPILSKEGYLFTRIIVGKPARYSWIRRWFFIQDGWFGACTVSTVDKVKGCVVIADRFRVSDCTCRINNDIDRRFLFEVVTDNNNSIILQAETEDELQSWIKTFENFQQHKQKQKDEESGKERETTKKDNNNEMPGPLLASKIYLDITRLNTGLITMSNSPALTALGSQSRELVPSQSTISRLISIMVGNEFSESSKTLNARSSSPDSIASENNNSNNNNDDDDNNDNNNTTRNGDSSSSSSSSSPPLPPPPPPLASASSLSRNNTLSSPTSTSSWTMPWIMSGLLANNSNSSSSVDASFYGTQDGAANGFISLPKGGEENGIVIFPTRIEMEATVVQLNGYTGELASRQRELRRLFSNVPESEIVIEAFSTSLYRQAGGGTSIDEHSEEHDHTHITSTLSSTPSPPPTTISSSSSTGYYTNEYGYSGRGYITQNYLWFYHCSLMTCINTVVIPLDSIKSVRLEKTLSNASHGMLMFVETKSTPPKTFCFGIWLEPAEVVGERLKMAIEASKNAKENDLQKLYDHMKAVIPEKIKSKQRPTSHLMHSSSLGAALTPLNVQAQPSSPQQHPSTDSTTIKNTLPPLEDKDNNDYGQHHQQQQQKPKKSISEQSTATMNHRHSAAAGALTAAMEAAKQQSSTSSSTNNTAESSPGKNKKYKKKKREMSIVDHQEYNDRMKPLPKGPVDCDCEDHLDKVEAKVQLSTSAEKLFGLMFSDKQSGPDSGSNSLWAKLNRTKQNSEPEITEWEANSEGIRERTLKYVMPLNNPMVKTRDTDVVETQQIHVENTRICYVVISSTKTPNLPYADAFVPIIKFCITYVSQNSCQLSCSIGVKWLKSIMVKSMVSRAAAKGMTDTIRALIPLVEHEVLLLDKENVPTTRTKTITEDEILRPIPPLPASPKIEKVSTETYRKKVLIPSVGRLFIICVIILVFYALFKRHHQSLPSTTNPVAQITWRAVFLRDLENGLIDNNNQNDTTSTNTIHSTVSPPESFLKHINPTLYRLFGQQYHNSHNRRHLNNSDGNNKGWFSVQHQLMGAELTYTRERLGALRYELLTAFKMLNTMDQRILENEYWNWVLNERLRCEHTDDDNNHNNNDGQNKDTCNQIIKEIKLAQ